MKLSYTTDVQNSYVPTLKDYLVEHVKDKIQTLGNEWENLCQIPSEGCNNVDISGDFDNGIYIITAEFRNLR